MFKSWLEDYKEKDTPFDMFIKKIRGKSGRKPLIPVNESSYTSSNVTYLYKVGDVVVYFKGEKRIKTFAKITEVFSVTLPYKIDELYVLPTWPWGNVYIQEKDIERKLSKKEIIDLNKKVRIWKLEEANYE